MAGVRERQKLAREQRILDEAGRLFAGQGYAASRIGQIARAAGLAVGTIYTYFPSKAEILLAIIRRDVQATLAGVEQVLKDPTLGPIEAVARLCDVYLSLLGRHDRRLWRELIGATLANPDTIAPAALQQDLRLLLQLAALIRELQGRGLLNPEVDPGRAAMTLSGVYVTWLLAYITSDDIDPDTVRRELRAGAEIIMKGLLA